MRADGFIRSPWGRRLVTGLAGAYLLVLSGLVVALRYYGEQRPIEMAETFKRDIAELEDVWHEATADTQFQLGLAGHRRACNGDGGGTPCTRRSRAGRRC